MLAARTCLAGQVARHLRTRAHIAIIGPYGVGTAVRSRIQCATGAAMRRLLRAQYAAVQRKVGVQVVVGLQVEAALGGVRYCAPGRQRDWQPVGRNISLCRAGNAKKGPILPEIASLPRIVLSPVRQATIHGIRPRIPLPALVCSTGTPGLNHNRYG